MKPSHQLRVFSGNGLVVVMDDQAKIIRFHSFAVDEELMESGNELFECLLADASLSAGWIEVSLVYAFRK